MTGRYTSVGDVVSIPCVNVKPEIHPSKREGDEGRTLLVERGGEVGSEIEREMRDYLTSLTRTRATTMYLGY